MVKLLYKHRYASMADKPIVCRGFLAHPLACLSSSTGLTPLKYLINNLALFFNDLYCILDRTRVTQMVELFLTEFKDLNDGACVTSQSASRRLPLIHACSLSDPVLVEFKFTFYCIICDYEFFVDVVDPRPITVGTENVIDQIR
jgi:hypothetical protein